MGYPIALGCVMAATAVRVALAPLVGDDVPFITYFPAVVIASLMAGFGPGLSAIVLSALSAWYFVLPPRLSLSLSNEKFSLALLAVFLGMAAVSVVFVAITSAVVKRVRALAVARSNLVDRQNLLIEELRHRTRNIFALVKMLATYTLKDNGNLADARASLIGRLEALSAFC